MQVVRYKAPWGVVTALVVKEGKKLVHAIIMDSAGIRISKLNKAEMYFMRDISDIYKVSKAKRLFKRAGKAFGITKSAKRALA